MKSHPKCACGKAAAYLCCFPLDGPDHRMCEEPVCVAHSRTEPGVHRHGETVITHQVPEAVK